MAVAIVCRHMLTRYYEIDIHEVIITHVKDLVINEILKCRKRNIHII